MTNFVNRIRIVYAAFVGCLLFMPGSPAWAGECKTIGEGAVVCGEGREAMRVIGGTNSPNLHFAIAWRERDGESREEPNPDNVENILMRLSDGARLLTLGGNYWETDKFRANRRDEYAFWSKDSRYLVEIANDRWDTFSLRAAVLEGDALAGSVDLLPLIEKEVRALRVRRKGGAPDRDLSFRVDPEEEHLPRVTAKGEVVLRALLFVPKSEDGQTAVDVRVQLAIKAGKLEARLISAKRVKG